MKGESYFISVKNKEDENKAGRPVSDWDHEIRKAAGEAFNLGKREKDKSNLVPLVYNWRETGFARNRRRTNR